MSEPLFTDTEKNKLAGYKFLYQHNTLEARRYAQCSLQAAEALGNILRLFISAAEKIRTPKNISYILARLKDNSGIQIILTAKSSEEQKAELEKKLVERLSKNKCDVNRLRKNVLR